VPDNGRIRVFINPDGVINGRLLIIGDSYSYNLAEVAACVFKEVVQIHVSDLEDGIIEELHPTHVIFEKAERFFIQKPLMFKNFFEIISKKIQDRGIASVGPIITRFNYYKPLPIHIGINGLISKMQNFLAKEKLIDGPLTFAPDINNHVGDFISLGKSCEYGLIQKFFQSENVGLLKWANVNFENLLRFILAFKDQDRLVEGFQIRPRVLDNGKITYFSHIDELGINFPSFEYFSEELTGDSLDDLSKKYFFRYKFLLRIFNESLIKGSNYVYLYLENQVDSWAENSRRLSSHLLTFNPQNRLIFVNYDAKMKNSVFIEDSESLLICRTCNAWNNEGPSSNIKYYFWADMAVRGHKYFTERATL